jgi:hypothetical protein
MSFIVLDELQHVCRAERLLVLGRSLPVEEAELEVEGEMSVRFVLVPVV